jgi:hypothetical protein
MGHVGSCAAHSADARLWLFPRSAKQKARLAGPLRSLPTEGLAGGVARVATQATRRARLGRRLPESRSGAPRLVSEWARGHGPSVPFRSPLTPRRALRLPDWKGSAPGSHGRTNQNNSQSHHSGWATGQCPGRSPRAAKAEDRALGGARRPVAMPEKGRRSRRVNELGNDVADRDLAPARSWSAPIALSLLAERCVSRSRRVAAASRWRCAG